MESCLYFHFFLFGNGGTRKKKDALAESSGLKAVRGSNEPENLRPEEGTLRLLNDLLVHRLRRVVHDHCALLVVDLSIHSGVADQVDDPLLALVLVQTQPGRQIPVG